jgi:hypothetical protein
MNLVRELHARIANRPPDAAVDHVAARLLEMEQAALALRRSYEGEVLRETMRAVAWRERWNRANGWLVVFVWLALALVVALVATNWWRM